VTTKSASTTAFYVINQSQPVYPRTRPWKPGQTVLLCAGRTNEPVGAAPTYRQRGPSLPRERTRLHTMEEPAMTVSAHTAPVGLGDSLRQLIRAEPLCASTLELSKADTVYSCLESDRSIYLVEAGQVKAVVSSRDGKECLLDIYTAGDVFGESCLLVSRRVESATAMSDTVLRRISSTRVLAALADAGLREQFVKYLARRVFQQQQLITDLITADSEYRLAVTLLNLAHKLGQREGDRLRIEQRITQEELSGMVGTTRSRVGYFLKRFCHAGLVSRTKDCFLVVDERRLGEFIMRGTLTSPGAAGTEHNRGARRPATPREYRPPVNSQAANAHVPADTPSCPPRSREGVLPDAW